MLIKKAKLYNGKTRDIFLGTTGVEEVSASISKRGEEKIKGNYLALPSFKNYHTHLAMTLFKGYADDLPLKEWLEDNIWPAEKRLNPSLIEAGTSLGLLELAKTGTSFFNDMYFYPEVTAKLTQKFGLRANVSSLFLDFGDLDKHDKDINTCLETQKAVSKYKNISFALSPHSPYSVGKEGWQFISRLSEQENIPIHTHLAETKPEVLKFKKEHKISELGFLKSHKVLNSRLYTAHSIHLSDLEISEFCRAKANPIYCPSSNMKLSSGVFPYSSFRRLGAKILLGTDGSASNNSLSMFSEIKIGCLLQKLSSGSTSLTAPEILSIACQSDLQVQKGMQDIILVNLDETNLPLNSIPSSIVYSGGKVDYLFVGNKPIVSEGKIKGEDKILSKAEKASKKLLNP